MRLFAGLPLPSDVADSLVQALAPARQRAPRARWVPPANLHVTLRFFGDVDDSARGALEPVFDREELRYPAIPCRLGATGQFPPRGAPRVLWVGLEAGAAEAHAFWEMLSRLLAPLQDAGGPLQGLPRDAREFTPHITVARAGHVPIRQDWAEGVAAPGAEFLISECILYQSLLGSEGARYIPRKRVPLGKGGM